MECSFRSARQELRNWIRSRGYAGIDPYDILRSSVPFEKLGKWPSILATQFQKRSPIDLRPLLGIHPTRDPKAIALLLEAACFGAENGDAEDREEADELYRILMDLRSRASKGNAWGYPFPWHSPERSLPAHSPNIVVTGTAARAIHAYYRLIGSEEALRALEGIAPFLLEELHRTEDDTGICFSYTTVRRDICYNASLLGAEHFARIYELTGDEEQKDLARKAASFVLARQYADGHWNYSEDPRTGREREQIDHHQGFILDSLRRVRDHVSPSDDALTEAIEKGLAFYRNEQFYDSGRALWRLPKRWPVDIHSQAQGIISFDMNRDLDPSYGAFAERIAEWTIRNMQGKDGSFIYRVTPLFKNRIRYMRWGQAWMMLALTRLSSSSAASCSSSRPTAQPHPRGTPHA